MLKLKDLIHNSPSGSVQYVHRYQSYDDDGNLLHEELIGDCGSISHQLDQKGRKIALVSPHLKQVINYDPCDNLVSIIEDNHTHSFTYDDLDQLTREQSTHDSSTYAYDSNYNRIEKGDQPAQVNELNEIQSIGSMTCEHDLNGNLVFKKTSKETIYFNFDALNQLIEATSENRKIKFSYDPLGRRVSKVVQESNNYGRPQNHPNPHQHEHKPNPTGGTRIRDPKGQPVTGWNYS